MNLDKCYSMMNIQKCYTKNSPLFTRVENTPGALDALSFLTCAEVSQISDSSIFEFTFEDGETMFVEEGEYVVLFADDLLVCDKEYFTSYFHTA